MALITVAMCYSSSIRAAVSKKPDNCTKIISTSKSIKIKSIPIYTDLNKALAEYDAGDVFCLDDGFSPRLTIKNFKSGNKPLTIQPLNNLSTIISSKQYTGTGIRIENSDGININGLIITGGLFAIKVVDSSNIKLMSNVIYNVGNEGVLINPKVRGGMNFLVYNNVIFNTGNLQPQYGEAVYIGDGSYNKDRSGLRIKSTISNVTITDNIIYNTRNEAIDIKSNAYDIKIIGNSISNIDLQFNAAITVGTEASFSNVGGYHIENNVITGIKNRSGYKPIGIAIGHGDATVINNTIVDNGKNVLGICLFTTFLNPKLNKVTLINNQLIGSGTLMSKKCTGGTKSNAHAVVELEL